MRKSFGSTTKAGLMLAPRRKEFETFKRVCFHLTENKQKECMKPDFIMAPKSDYDFCIALVKTLLISAVVLVLAVLTMFKLVSEVSFTRAWALQPSRRHHHPHASNIQ